MAEASERVLHRALVRGDQLRNANRCEEAINVWRGALRLSGHWIFLERIGQCYRILGQRELSITYLRRVLRETDNQSFLGEWGPQIRQTIAQLESELPTTLEVASDVGGASISIDQVSQGVLPLAEPLPVEPGEHVVTLRREGFEDRSFTTTANQGQRNAVTFQLAPAHVDEPAPGLFRQPRRASRLWSLVFFGIGTLLNGLGSWLVAINTRADLKPEIFLGNTPETLVPGVGLISVGLSLVLGGSLYLINPPTAR